MEEAEERKAIFAGFNSGKNKTAHFCFLGRQDDIEEESDKVPVVSKELIEFIYKQIPYTVILKKNVSRVEVDKFQKEKEQFTRQIDEMRKNGQLRERVLKEQVEQLVNDRKEIELQQKKQEEEFKKQLRELQEKRLQEREEHKLFMEKKEKEFSEAMATASREQAEQLKRQQEEFEKRMAKKDEQNRASINRLNQQLVSLQSRPPQITQGVSSDPILGLVTPILTTVATAACTIF